MARLLSSLQFRLVAGFALVLGLALVGVGLYAGRVVDREAKQLAQDVDDVRAGRIQQVISRHFLGRPNRIGLQGALEQASSLYGWRIVVNDVEGRVVADSHDRFRPPLAATAFGKINIPIVTDGRRVASAIVAPRSPIEGAPEPVPSRLAAALNRSLLWTGLVAAFGGVLMVTIVSRRVLAPVRKLRFAARRLGQGDLSQRVSSPGRDEIGDLGRTFNSMADDLERAEQQRRNLMADVAHELRTPLSNIQGYLEAVRDGLVEPNSATIETIAHQASLLSRLVEDLRLVALAEAGALSLSLAPESLEQVLRAAVESFRPRAQASGIDLSPDIPAEFPTVEMDRGRITQVVGILIENAIVHTPEKGRVIVMAELAGGVKAKVTVADTGEGIPPQDISKVFERFYRVDPSRSRATGGVGLGLTIARQLVEAHRGTLRAESEPGNGSRFIFELPLISTQGGTE